MSELGSGSGTSYPGGLDTDDVQEVNSPNPGKTKARAEVPNDMGAAIIAIEKELGTDPAGTETDVKTFLQTEHGVDGTHGTVSPITTNSVTTDVINEKTGAAGVTIDSFAIKDNAPNPTSWPSFSVNRNNVDQQNITGFDKIEWTTEIFDTNSNFDKDTNFRFTPTAAGKYILLATISWINLTAGQEVLIFIRKNGSSVFQDSTIAPGASFSQSITAIVDANGTTDYFEVFAINNSVDTSDVEGETENTFFCGSRIA